MVFKTEQELLNFTKGIIGKKFNEIDKENLLKTSKNDKGILGKVVETGFYGYKLNNKAEADFADLGIELKVSGFKRNKDNSLVAKERLSLGMIDYCKIIDEEFEFSKLLFKNKKLLIIWYEYEQDKKDNQGEFEIKYYQLYDMCIDEEVFKNDFNIIKKKVLDGKAHLLSEGDTSYLGAGTKGSKGKTKLQPKSTILAKTRAFTIKNGYMTGVLRSMYTENQKSSKFKTAQSYVYEKLKPYFGLTQKEIWKMIGEYELDEGKSVPKNFSKMISDRIVGKDNELSKVDDVFNKVTYAIKNLSVNRDNYPLERLSFKNVDINALEEEWETSEWRNYFEEINLIIIIYEGSKDIKNGDRVLKDVKSISFTSNDIELFKPTYKMVQEAIKSRDIKKLPYPKSYPNQILEIAPKGGKGANAYQNFFKTKKTCFMMDKDFVNSKID